MEDPRNEVHDVVYGLVRAENADKQRDVLQRYYLPSASFDHPMCSVTRSRHSRDAGVLQIYQFLRILFMDTEIKIHSSCFDEENNRVYLEATQHLRSYIPFVRKYLYDRTARLVVLLDLRKLDDGKYYVSRQQDPYHAPSCIFSTSWYLDGAQLKLMRHFGCVPRADAFVVERETNCAVFSFISSHVDTHRCIR